MRETSEKPDELTVQTGTRLHLADFVSVVGEYIPKGEVARIGENLDEVSTEVAGVGVATAILLPTPADKTVVELSDKIKTAGQVLRSIGATESYLRQCTIRVNNKRVVPNTAVFDGDRVIGEVNADGAVHIDKER
jgi:hypothetical protein